MYILTIDIGTSSTRAMLFNSQAQPVPGMMAQEVNHLRTTPDGGTEFIPSNLLANVIAVVDRLLALAESKASQISGVAMATLVTNLLGLDASGVPITPVYTYADTRCAEDVAQLTQELEPFAVHQRTGCRIHSSYQPARFRWLARTDPALLSQVSQWLSISDYLMGEFTGSHAISHSVASWSGLLNRQTLQWDNEWLSSLPIDKDQLSPLRNMDQPVVGLKKEWADRWPQLKEVPWFPGIGDGAAANVGSGCDRPDRVALTIGTTGAMRVVLDHEIPQVPDGLWSYRVDQHRSLLGGATSEGGNLFHWLHEILQLPPNHEEELTSMPPTAHGITLLPFIAGERAPGWQDTARASFIGMTQHTRPIEILQAGLESIAYRFALIHQRISPHLPAEHQIIASGNALLHSPVWAQIFADVLGRPLLMTTGIEATSRGVALLALEALGISKAKEIEIAKVYQPNKSYHQLYQEALRKQIEMYEILILPS